MAAIKQQSRTTGLGCCAALAGISLIISIALHFHQLSDRGAAAVRNSSRRECANFAAALEQQWLRLYIFSGDERLIDLQRHFTLVCQLAPELLPAGTPHDAIIEHRVTNGMWPQRRSTTRRGRSSSISISIPAMKNGSGGPIAEGHDRGGAAADVGGGWLATPKNLRAGAAGLRAGAPQCCRRCRLDIPRPDRGCPPDGQRKLAGDEGHGGRAVHILDRLRRRAEGMVPATKAPRRASTGPPSRAIRWRVRSPTFRSA